MSDDWRSYDRIAAFYDEVWGARFADAARQLVARVEKGAIRRVLDIGTGTAFNAAMVVERFGPLGQAVGCDLSAGMLVRARDRIPGLRPVMADAARLPFAEGSFDLATAGFVLSHVRDCSAALREAFRVLAPSGALAVSSWAPSTDPFAAAWVELVETVLPQDTVQRANAAVAPSEAVFADPRRLRGALEEAGFVGVRLESRALAFTFTVREFLADRALSSGGRLARHELGAERWAAFLSRAERGIESRFGPRFRYDRSVLMATASKPAS